MKSVLFWVILLLMPAVLAAPVCGREYSVFDVVGDSVSDGANPEYYHLFQKYGWVHMLFGQAGPSNPAPEQTIFDLWPGITNYNSSISGSTAAEWADTNSYPYLRTVLDHKPDLVIIMIGGNDLLDYTSDGQITEQELAEYRTNLTSIIGMLRAELALPEIVLLDYYDLFDGFSTNLPPLYAAYRPMSRAALEGSGFIRDIAASNQCFFMSILGDFLHHCYGEEIGDTGHILPDYVRLPIASFDIHPVTAGYWKIYELMYGQLRELKDIPKFRAINCSAGEADIRWSGGFGQQFVVEYSSDLAWTDYSAVGGTNVSTPPVNIQVDTTADPVRFYRIRVVE